jgi:cation:H+ antiporter
VGTVFLDLAGIATGLLLLVAGSRWLVDGAVAVARTLGVSELVIGLTAVAAGTSLPEAATSLTAAVRGQRDLAVGNVVGSNIFNILFVLGLAGITAPGGIPVSPAALTFDLPVMAAVAAACIPIFYTGYRIERWEGILFLLYFVAYMTFLVLDRSNHGAAPIFAGIMAGFVIPITAVGLLALWIRQFQKGSGPLKDRIRARDPDPTAGEDDL